MADAFSDETWADICAAAQRTPNAEARAELSKFLFEEYPAFAYDRARWAEAAKRAKRMLKHLNALAGLYRQTYAPDLPMDQLEAVLAGRAEAIVADKRTERDLWCIARLRRRPEAIWLAASVLRHANARHKSLQREWLYHRLCGAWLDHFGASDLTYSVPSTGGPPRGPLIAFILTAIRQVVAKEALPSPETVRDAIDRERCEREKAKQLFLQLRRRPMGA